MARPRRLVHLLGAALTVAAAASTMPAAAAAACPAANGDAYSTTVLGNDPIAYYRLNETSGSSGMCDSSSDANNGTYVGTGLTFGVPGPILAGTDTGVGEASGGSGIGDSASSFTGQITGRASWTLQGWFKSTGTTQDQALVAMGAAGSGEIVGLTTWNNESCGAGNASSYASTLGLDEDLGSNCWNTAAVGDESGNPINVYDGNWHFLAITYNVSADTVTGYVDGQSLGSQTPTTAFDLASGPIRIGYWVDTTVNQPLIGDAAEIAVFPTALTAAEIAAEYEASSTVTNPTDTSTAVSCIPPAPPDGTASTCTATVTGSAASAPTGTVSFIASPSSGTFSDTGTCTVSAGTGDTSSCDLTFTTSTGGGYTITGNYSGDDANVASDGSTTIVAIDPTSTSVSCPTTGVTVGDPINCTATVTDSGGNAAMYGSVEFATDPATSGALQPSSCTENTTASSTTVSCPVQFTPPQVGVYELSATYCGDDGATPPSVCSGDGTDLGGDHAPSTGSTPVTVNLTPSGGSSPPTTLGGTGPSGGNGQPGGPGVLGNPPTPARGLIKLGSKLKVSRRNQVIVPLACKGKPGAKCTGTVALDMQVAVVNKHPALGGSRRTVYVVELATGSFSVKAPGSTSVRVKLTKTALKILKAAKAKSLSVTATATEFGSIVTEQKAKLTIHAAPRRKKHKKTKHKR
jgi:hypothetical protein